MNLWRVAQYTANRVYLGPPFAMPAPYTILMQATTASDGGSGFGNIFCELLSIFSAFPISTIGLRSMLDIVNFVEVSFSSCTLLLTLRKTNARY